MNSEEQQTFRGGNKLTKAEEATYLGKTLNCKANATTEIEKQIQQISITMWILNSYWKATEASKKWQLLIFDAVSQSNLLYGMETVQLTEAVINKLDAFQMKGLRKNLGGKHTYWDRTATNESILETATRIVRTSRKIRKRRKRLNGRMRTKLRSLRRSRKRRGGYQTRSKTAMH